MPTVEVSSQVLNFVRTQAPEPRRRLRLAIRGLAAGRGDIRALEGNLEGYHRLRIGSFRVVFAYASNAGSMVVIRCIFADRRDVVYGVFSAMLQARLLKE